MSRTRRIIFGITLVAAIYIIVVTFALSLFSRTRDAENLSDYYRPFMSAQGISRFRGNLRIVNAGGKELYGSFLPQVESKLGMNDAQFNAFVTQDFPQVAAFLKRAPQVVKYLNPATQRVLAQQDNFHDADQFPVANLDVTLGPWSLLLLGLGLGVLAVLTITTTSRLAMIAIFVVGVGLVAGPPLLGWFHQTDAAEHVAEAARAPFSAAVANTTVDDTYKFDAAFKEMRRAMFPAVARQLGMSDTQLDTYLHTSFPATMRFLDSWDRSIYRGAHDLSLSQIEFMDEFHNADSTPYRALPWLFMAPGVLLLVAGGLGLRRRRQPALSDD